MEAAIKQTGGKSKWLFCTYANKTKWNEIRIDMKNMAMEMAKADDNRIFWREKNEIK